MTKVSRSRCVVNELGGVNPIRISPRGKTFPALDRWALFEPRAPAGRKSTRQHSRAHVALQSARAWNPNLEGQHVCASAAP